jgi:hypothetical protein
MVEQVEVVLQQLILTLQEVLKQVQVYGLLCQVVQQEVIQDQGLRVIIICLK